jgi:hypothetical protein
VKDIKKYRLDWALLSPLPGPLEYEVFGGFERQFHLKPHRLRQAFLFRTRTVYQDSPESAVPPNNKGTAE